MNTNALTRGGRRSLGTALFLAICAMAPYATPAASADYPVTLNGNQEVPPVKSAGTGTGTLVVGDDGTMTGSVTTTGIAGTAAHVHEAALGKNGPVVIPLTKRGDTYEVPAGTKLSEAQLASLRAGKLYINVHTTANPGGELRAQLAH